MTVDMTKNRVPYGLLTDEEKAALHEHEKAGGKFERRWPHGLGEDYWEVCSVVGGPAEYVYRPFPIEKTQDVIAWEKLPDWVEWVARDEIGGAVHAYDVNDPWLTAEGGVWLTTGGYRRIDDFPGIVQIGTVDWTESKQRRPR